MTLFMKIYCKPSALAFLLLFGVSLAWNLSSCSTAQTGLIEAKDKCPNLVGTWLNEGELCSLTVRKDGTCAMVTHILEEGTIERIQGTWTQQGRTLTVNLKEKWRGDRTKTYYFNRKNWGEENWQDLLMIKYKGEEQFQFYRDND